jgi:hypothetical protein
VPILLLGHAHLRPHSLGGLYEKIFLAIELLCCRWSHGRSSAHAQGRTRLSTRPRNPASARCDH